ncbi:PREDICTED: polyhomeotic-like protein 3 isoform X8 [Branchiostoma belcheri]|uniref:Polyhomeotic-like protein 3 isoform X8 n=1 Tax=Branchiostoma belcheri TaxID=7741 RepID=A0A6P5A2J5_BRABE|nr:PREDICTED: polyhomeotic-like protein 3 isoform X8 [Branchiostoma belcheri]
MNDRQTSSNVPTTQQPPAAHQSHSAPSLASQVQVIQQALHRGGQPVTSVSAAQYSALQQMYMQQQLLLQNMAAQQQALGSSAVGQHGLSLTQANRQVLSTQSGTVTSQAQLLTTPAALQLLGPRMAAAAGAGGLSLSQPLQLVGQAGQPLYTTCTPQQLHSVLLQAQQAQSAAASQQAQQAATAQLQKQAAASMAQQQAGAQLALGPATSAGSTGSSSTPPALLSQLPSRGQGSVQALPLRGPPVPPASSNQSKPSQSKQLDQSEKRVSTSPKKTDSSTVEKSKSQSSHPVPQAIAIGQPSSAKAVPVQYPPTKQTAPAPPVSKLEAHSSLHLLASHAHHVSSRSPTHDRGTSAMSPPFRHAAQPAADQQKTALSRPPAPKPEGYHSYMGSRGQDTTSPTTPTTVPSPTFLQHSQRPHSRPTQPVQAVPALQTSPKPTAPSPPITKMEAQHIPHHVPVPVVPRPPLHSRPATTPPSPTFQQRLPTSPTVQSMGIQLGASSLGSPPPPEAKTGHIHHVHPHVQPPVQQPPQPVQAHNPQGHAIQAAHVPPTHVQAAHVQPTHVQPLSQPLPLALATHKPVQTAPPLPQQPTGGPPPVAQPSAIQQPASQPQPSALSVLPTSQPSQRQIPTPGPQSRLTPPPAQPQRPQSLPPPVSTSAMISQQAPPRVPSPKQNGVTETTPAQEKVDDAMKSPEPPKEDPMTSHSSELPLALNKPPTEKQQPQRAVVKPQILTHLIDGFIIQEGPQPFPIKHNSILVESRRPQAGSAKDQPEAGPSSENGSTLLIQSPDGKQPAKKPKKPQDKTLLKCEFCGKVDYQYRFRGSKRWLIFYTKRFCSMACAKRYNVGCTKRLGLFTPKQPSRYISKKKRERKSSSRKSPSGSEVSPSRLYSTSMSPEAEDVQMSEPMDFSPPHEQLSPRAPLASPSRIVNRHNSFGSTDTELDLGPANPNPARWSVEEVWEFIRSLPGCSDFADEFRAQEIDGQALMLLKEDHLMSAMNMKLGPALKICARINSLKQDS